MLCLGKPEADAAPSSGWSLPPAEAGSDLPKQLSLPIVELSSVLVSEDLRSLFHFVKLSLSPQNSKELDNTFSTLAGSSKSTPTGDTGVNLLPRGNLNDDVPRSTGSESITPGVVRMMIEKWDASKRKVGPPPRRHQ